MPQLFPVYVVIFTMGSILIAPQLVRWHLALFETTRVRESPELRTRHERHVRILSRVYRAVFLVVGTLAMVSWFTGFGWD